MEKLSTLRTSNKKEVMTTLKLKHQKDMELFNKLLNLQDPSSISKIINEHWSRKWRQTEAQIFDKHSGIAYKQLKSILKYHMFQKRDGGVINSILRENGVITDKHC